MDSFIIPFDRHRARQINNLFANIVMGFRGSKLQFLAINQVLDRQGSSIGVNNFRFVFTTSRISSAGSNSKGALLDTYVTIINA